MPSQDAKRASDQGRRMSRRSLLQGAATAGAAGLAVTTIGAAASPAFAATNRTSAAQTSTRTSSENLPSGAITVHVRDAKTGDVEVFHGTSSTRLRDKDLAARIARAIR
jgi:nitrous oxide reductase